MLDPRVERLAQTIVNYSASVKPGDKVFLWGDISGLPLLREVYKQCVVAGGHVLMNITDDASTDFLVRNGSPEQLEWLLLQPELPKKYKPV